MNIISAVYWEKGMQEHNRDSLLLEQVYVRTGRILLAVVCDGMDSLAEGETASGMAVEKLLLHFYQEIVQLAAKHKSRRHMIRSFKRCFYELNQMLNYYSKSYHLQLGTTVSLLLIFGSCYVIFQLGSSRVYRLQKEKGQEKLQRLTRIHADKEGRMLRCMGSFAYQSPDIKTGRLKSEMAFLLCTDSFVRELSEPVLLEVLNPGDVRTNEQAERRLEQLAEYGRRKGIKENCSAVYIKLRR